MGKKDPKAAIIGIGLSKEASIAQMVSAALLLKGIVCAVQPHRSKEPLSKYLALTERIQEVKKL